jgi:hypothetical protein
MKLWRENLNKQENCNEKIANGKAVKMVFRKLIIDEKTWIWNKETENGNLSIQNIS